MRKKLLFGLLTSLVLTLSMTFNALASINGAELTSSNNPQREGEVSMMPLPERPPLLRMGNDEDTGSRYAVQLTGNNLLDVLLYSQHEAVQAIIDDMDLFFSEVYIGRRETRLVPNEEWIRENTRDSSNYENPNNIVIVNDLNTVSAYRMDTNEVLEDFEIDTTDSLTKAILQTLVAPDTVLPTTEKIMRDFGLSELPSFIRGEPFVAENTAISPMSWATYSPVNNTRVAPYHSIAFIIVTWPNGEQTRATGFLTHNNIVLTSGHAIYNHIRGGWPSNIRVYPGLYPNPNGGVSNRPYNGFNINLMAVGWTWQHEFNRDGDFGVLRLSTNANNVPSYLRMQAMTNAQLQGRAVSTAGYSVAGWPPESMWRSDGNIGRENRYTANHQIHARGLLGGDGTSGSPIFDTSTRAVVGIMWGRASNIFPGAWDGVSAVRIEQGKIDWINNTFRPW